MRVMVVVGACEVWVRAWFGGGVDGVICFGLVRGAMNGLGSGVV